ncbi:hypothetical protein [Brevibacillus thermoruber]|uniref:hypothetical protein n=1 Tax=Brevibacillus thermoruber TaxID=33942 RepID=UPI001E370ABF|nr:hypothetical protein [Brevibacillus thermoruber]
MFASWFEQDDTLQISSSSMDKLKIDRERNVVVVPAGTTIDGDLVVRNGNVEVLGKVKGNVSPSKARWCWLPPRRWREAPSRSKRSSTGFGTK